ncbi:zinc ribbon domain-containing protein [Desulfosporosinus sp.]|uniref:FmdB family zinc ribbon protein n=1 Tax=Desulfosporosinus sp. TaxID=157907 RepID=UPI000E829DC3|nr:zinc ribbon domain-containing protein [Desulfosporosinus sp.]MBC2722727.1 zinc ribbon domain-containing protein [Desulfosporosinus sp.]MBC2729053.1 zinc ribbon domain-containing protein [Desulfosporosinus sp.]HBV86492.1 zinc ribbon domain-containing protein [Desulfosporosinus sp.]
MPMYEFGCPNCGGVTTELCKMGEIGEQLMCSKCGHTGLTKHISGFASLGISGGAGSGGCSSGCSGNCTGCQ